MNKVLQPFLVCIVILCFTGAANAVSYVGADIGFTDFPSGNTFHNATTSNKRGYIMGIYSGNRLHKNFAAEVGYVMITRIKMQIAGAEQKVSAHLFHASGLAYLPMPDSVPAILDAYGRLGVGYTSAKAGESSNAKTALLYGVGAELRYYHSVILRAEVLRIPNFAIQSNPVTIYQLGVHMKF